MKKGFAAAALAAVLIFGGCSEQGADIIINADGYEGILADAESTAATAALIPPVTSGPIYSDVTSDSFGISDISDSSDTVYDTRRTETEGLAADTESTQTSPVYSASESVAATEEITQSAKETEASDTSYVTTAAASVTASADTEAVTSASSSATAETEEPIAFVTEPAIDLPLGGSSYKTLNYSEVKGVWISYLELSSILTGKTESQFTASIRQVYDNCVKMGLNTVYVHVRSHGDAYYKSDYYPWSKYVTGTLGQAPSFDPLEIMISEAHSAGLSFQAWINPYRLNGISEIDSVSSDYPTGSWYLSSKGDRVVAEGSYYYLNPGYDEADELIAAGAKEIVTKYNVDGIHIDDYFYPTTDKAFDSKAFAASGYSSLYQFRTDNCTEMVKTLYNAVKEGNGTALFGVAPQGNIGNNYDYMYADVKTWCSGAGYIDYIMPQIYFGFKNSGQPYETVLSDWQAMVGGSGVKLIPGLGVYKIGNEDSYGGSSGRYEWQTDTEIIKRQIEASKNAANYGGFVLYSYNHVFAPDSNASLKKAEMEAVKIYINQN